MKDKKKSLNICPDKKTAIEMNKKTNKIIHDPLGKEKERKKNATLKNVYNVSEKYLHINDRNRIDLILAVTMSNELPGTPLWMYIVGNSGDWKSAFVKTLEGCKNVIKRDQITKNTLASGKEGVEDLGSELNQTSTILIFPDLAALTSMNTDDKNAIWGQMRNLYDGFIDKQAGSGVHRVYDGCHVTMIACTTQTIRNEILIHSQLGTRELMYDTNAEEADNDFKMDKAWENEEYEKEMDQEMHEAVDSFLTYNKIKRIIVPNDMKQWLKKEANRLSILRATGVVDRTYKELINPIYPEVPTRLIKQFKRLYIALKSLDDNYPDKKVKEIISHIVDSSGNKVRQIVMKTVQIEKDWLKVAEIQQKTRLGRKSIKGQLEMLWNLRIIEKEVRQESISGYENGRIEDIAYYKFIDKTQTKQTEFKKNDVSFNEKYGKELCQDFFDEHYNMNYGETKEKIISDLIIIGVLDFITEDQLETYVDNAINGKNNTPYVA